MEKGRIAVIIGTRPEGIKLCPLVLKMLSLRLPVTVINTGQHARLLSEVMDLFSVKADITLPPLHCGEDLCMLLSSLVSRLGDVFSKAHYSLAVVQGDTASAYAGALSAFLHRIPILHIEAGLRSGDLYSPFPEECFRKSITAMASLHIAPTPEALKNLWQEGVEKTRCFLYGNTVEDALFRFLPKAQEKNGPMVLTVHRREHGEKTLVDIFSAVKKLLALYPAHSLLYPMHPSLRVRRVAKEILGGEKQICLCEPLVLPAFYSALAKAPLVLTDSGGVQEECAMLGVKTLVLRENTERINEQRHGRIRLAGTEPSRIIAVAKELLALPEQKRMESRFGSPSDRICELLLSFKSNGFDKPLLFR